MIGFTAHKMAQLDWRQRITPQIAYVYDYDFR